MYFSIDGFGWVAVVYFIAMVVFCSFFLLNILIAVIMLQFKEVTHTYMPHLYAYARKGGWCAAPKPAPITDTEHSLTRSVGPNTTGGS